MDHELRKRGTKAPLGLTQILPSSLPGLTRQSINFLNKKMDARVNPRRFRRLARA